MHPLQLVRVASQLEGLSPSAIYGLLATFPGPEHRLLHQDQVIAIVRTNLAPTDAFIVERAIWKGTIAYIVYDFIRRQSYRRRNDARVIGLGAAFHEGETAQGLSVPELVSLLQSMVVEARGRSQASGRLPDAN